MSDPMQGPVSRPRAERTTTSCGECRRRKQKVMVFLFSFLLVVPVEQTTSKRPSPVSGLWSQVQRMYRPVVRRRALLTTYCLERSVIRGSHAVTVHDDSRSQFASTGTGGLDR
jgi:hypothetical protein